MADTRSLDYSSFTIENAECCNRRVQEEEEP